MSAKINPTATAEVPHAVQAWVPGQATATATNKGGRRPTMQELDDAKFVKSCTIDKQSKDHMYDVDGDGELDALEIIMKRYDTNGDGVFDLHEVREIVRDAVHHEAHHKHYKRVALAMLIGALCVCGVMLGLMMAANEASKESHVVGGVNVGLDGKVVQSKSLASFASVHALGGFNASDLDELDYISFSATKGAVAASNFTFDNATNATADPGDDFESMNARLRVAAWFKSDQDGDLTLRTQDGSQITISGDQSSANLTLAGDATLGHWEIENPAVKIDVPADGNGEVGDTDEDDEDDPTNFTATARDLLEVQDDEPRHRHLLTLAEVEAEDPRHLLADPAHELHACSGLHDSADDLAQCVAGAVPAGLGAAGSADAAPRGSTSPRDDDQSGSADEKPEPEAKADTETRRQRQTDMLHVRRNSFILIIQLALLTVVYRFETQ